MEAGVRVYAIGDIHGRADLLRSLHAMILDDARSQPIPDHLVAVYTGDYVDRGLQSREVVEFLVGEPLPDFQQIFLKGNHEDCLLQFLVDFAVGPDWMSIGGNATLYSYGLRVEKGLHSAETFSTLGSEFRDRLPPSHLRFFQKLQLSYQRGDYFFCHAGCDPGRPLDKQRPEDLMWIRKEFTQSTRLHGKIVVHGHTLSTEPEIRPNRIGIDTGAYFSNRLTCLVLEGRARRFLQTQ